MLSGHDGLDVCTKLIYRQQRIVPVERYLELYFCLISLIVCAEMWLIISAVNGETQMIKLLCQTKALNGQKVALEVNIFFVSFMHFIEFVKLSLGSFPQKVFLHAVFFNCN